MLPSCPRLAFFPATRLLIVRKPLIVGDYSKAASMCQARFTEESEPALPVFHSLFLESCDKIYRTTTSNKESTQMAKRRKRKSRSLSEIMVWIISFLVIISMAVGVLLMLLPQPEPPAIELDPRFVVVTQEIDDVEETVEGQTTDLVPKPVPNPIPTP
jgi:hypothetical protein